MKRFAATPRSDQARFNSATLLAMLIALGCLTASTLRATDDPPGEPFHDPRQDAAPLKPPPPSEPGAKQVEGVTPEGVKYVDSTVRGKVVWLDEALKRRHNVTSDLRAKKTTAVLETPDGQLLPLAADMRGFAFTLDDRLRDIDLQLWVRRFEGSPYLQIIRQFQVKPDGLYEMEYWCDICSIPMYILKDCDCCQGPIRLKVEPAIDVP